MRFVKWGNASSGAIEKTGGIKNPFALDSNEMNTPAFKPSFSKATPFKGSPVEQLSTF